MNDNNVGRDNEALTKKRIMALCKRGRNVADKFVGAIEILKRLGNNIKMSGLQQKVPEYMTKEASVHIKKLRYYEKQFAEDTRENAKTLNKQYHRAMRVAVAAETFTGTHGTWIRFAASIS